MVLYPTRATFHVAIAGALMVALGVALRVPLMAGVGGAMLSAIAIGRAFALTAVTKLRGAGFEMVWGARGRFTRVARGDEVVLSAELRNRGEVNVRGIAVRAIASSLLEVRVHPQEIDLPAGSRVRFDITVRAPRVGRWGLHGLALEVRGVPVGGDALYEVPLMFANPHGVEVLPRARTTALTSPRGGRARRRAPAGSAQRMRGEGDELREIRHLVPGDPFKRIAWKASARRGALLVRETEAELEASVMVVLDASVEGLAGIPGEAPLDRAIDEAAGLMRKHQARGQAVGLVVYAGRLLTFLSPDRGPKHETALNEALLGAISCLDDDRSEADEREIAQRVTEHLRPLDPAGLAGLGRNDLDGVAARADGLKHRAPFQLPAPRGASLREQRLRHYLGVFGLELPPRGDGELQSREAELLRSLLRIRSERTASLVYVLGQPPSHNPGAAQVLKKMRSARIQIVWYLPQVDVRALPLGAPTQAMSLRDAVLRRARLLALRQRRWLRKHGVQVSRQEVPHE